MKKVILFYAITVAMLCLCSCSRIVSADMEVLDDGIISERGKNYVSVISSKDSVERQYFPEIIHDALSVWSMKYSDSLNVGDKCYVYDDDNSIFISKVSINDAKLVNDVLSKRYWKQQLDLSGNLLLVLIMSFVVSILLFLWKDKSSDFGPIIVMVSTFFAVVLQNPGRHLDKIDGGTITAVNDKCFFIDDKKVYFAEENCDFFYNDNLKIGDSVCVYVYADYQMLGLRGDVFISRKDVSDYVLEKPQIYPEIVLYTVVCYLLLICAFFYLLKFSSIWQKK